MVFILKSQGEILELKSLPMDNKNKADRRRAFLKSICSVFGMSIF